MLPRVIASIGVVGTEYIEIIPVDAQRGFPRLEKGNIVENLVAVSGSLKRVLDNLVT
jgi:hypothetical protein